MYATKLFQLICTILIANVVVLMNGVLAEVQTINKDTLDVITKQTKYILVHIRNKKECDAVCEEDLKLLSEMQEAVFKFEVKVFSMVSPKLLKPYDNKDKQANNKLFFYRHSIPLLYQENKIEKYEVLEFVQLHRSMPYSRILDDQGFEHQTQASTGSTTGDWFILFFSSACDEYISMWETLAARLVQQKVVAIVNMDTSPISMERFHMKLCPSAIYLRGGKYYRYEQPMELSKLVLFAEGWFKNAPSSLVLPLPSHFDKVLEHVVNLMKDSEVFKYLMLLPPFIIFFIIIIFSFKHFFTSNHTHPEKDD